MRSACYSFSTAVMLPATRMPPNFTCVRGVLIRSLAFHIKKCAPRAATIAALADCNPSARFTNRTQYPAGSALLDVQEARDRALAAPWVDSD